MTAATVTPPRFPDHVAARIAAAWEDGPAIPRLPIPGPRGPVDHAGDSDPDADELYRRARELRSNLTICPECNGLAGPNHTCPKYAPTPAGLSALDGDEWELAVAERNAQLAADVQREIAGAAA